MLAEIHLIEHTGATNFTTEHFHVPESCICVVYVDVSNIGYYMLFSAAETPADRLRLPVGGASRDPAWGGL